MGLETTHNCWHGPYSSFGRWREKLARIVGIDLPSMEGFGGDGKWANLPPDVLHILLNHSDCDGKIKAKDCKALANRLEDIQREFCGPLTNWIEGLRDADEAGEDVEFQ